MNDVKPPPVDVRQLVSYRLARLQHQLTAGDCMAAVLFDPINVNYALGTIRYPVFQFHLPSQYALVPQMGKPTLFEDYGTHTRSEFFERQPAINLNYLHTGDRNENAMGLFRAVIGGLLPERGHTSRRLAVDRAEPAIISSLHDEGFATVNAAPYLERARAIKSETEVLCIRHAIEVAQLAMHRVHESLRPGVTERELLSIFHQTNIANGGHWLEYALLVSGPRTNPWLEESTMRPIEAGDLVAFDSGLIGPLGYCADVSRTFHCGPGAPSPDQRTLYKLAHDEIEHNVGLLRPGLSYRDFSRQSWKPPAPFGEQRYPLLAHGVGLCDEHPLIVPPEKWCREGVDGTFEAGMVICVESYVGRIGGTEGVKLEQQVLITEGGHEVLSTFPFEEALLT